MTTGGQVATAVVASALPRVMRWFRVPDTQGYRTLSRWSSKEVTTHNDLSVGSLNVAPCVSPGHSRHLDPQGLPRQHLGKCMFSCCFAAVCCSCIAQISSKVTSKGKLAFRFSFTRTLEELLCPKELRRQRSKEMQILNTHLKIYQNMKYCDQAHIHLL